MKCCFLEKLNRILTKHKNNIIMGSALLEKCNKSFTTAWKNDPVEKKLHALPGVGQ